MSSTYDSSYLLLHIPPFRTTDKNIITTDGFTYLPFRPGPPQGTQLKLHGIFTVLKVGEENLPIFINFHRLC